MCVYVCLLLGLSGVWLLIVVLLMMSYSCMCMICASHYLPFHGCPDLDVSLIVVVRY